MGACCSASLEDEEVLLISKADGSVAKKVKKTLLPFASLNDPTFVLGNDLVAGPHCIFSAPKRSPQGVKPFSLCIEALKPLRKSPFFHGGEQMLFVAWCNVEHSDGGKEEKGVRLVALMATGTLFVIKGANVTSSARVQTTCHAIHIASATIAGDSVTLSFITRKQPWRISANAEVAGQLATLLWVCSSTAHAACLMRVNLARQPLELLPPLAVDGNLHTCSRRRLTRSSTRTQPAARSLARPPFVLVVPNRPPTRAACALRVRRRCYVMHANAMGLFEPEDCLQAADPELSPSLLCIRRWLTRMEVDVSLWKPEALAPLASALKYNGVMFAFKAVGATHLGKQLPFLSFHRPPLPSLSFTSLSPTSHSQAPLPSLSFTSLSPPSPPSYSQARSWASSRPCSRATRASSRSRWRDLAPPRPLSRRCAPASRPTPCLASP